MIILKEFKINNNYNESEEPAPVKIRKWYDRKSSNWVVQLLDRHDNQIGDAIYVNSKTDATFEEEELRKRYGL